MCPVAATGKAYQVDFEGPKVLKSVGITHTHQGGRVHWVSNWVLLTL